MEKLTALGRLAYGSAVAVPAADAPGDGEAPPASLSEHPVITVPASTHKAAAEATHFFFCLVFMCKPPEFIIIYQGGMSSL
jgi:hypothetical protein